MVKKEGIKKKRLRKISLLFELRWKKEVVMSCGNGKFGEGKISPFNRVLRSKGVVEGGNKKGKDITQGYYTAFKSNLNQVLVVKE
ncbi:hypothetical protein GOBAR_DD00562 [Gossypium barbadense]|nr:hypothetical protein GOBAR_DD00562 [Gossypium barbadense]